MKEIMIIDIQKICKGCRFNTSSLCDKSRQDVVSCEEGKEKTSVIEQVPETFEELKDLCRNSKIPKCYFAQNLFIKTEEPLTYYEHIWVDGVLFLEDGSIYAGYENDNVSTNRTPAQMWEIIKNLIGE